MFCNKNQKCGTMMLSYEKVTCTLSLWQKIVIDYFPLGPVETNPDAVEQIIVGDIDGVSGVTRDRKGFTPADGQGPSCPWGWWSRWMSS